MALSTSRRNAILHPGHVLGDLVALQHVHRLPGAGRYVRRDRPSSGQIRSADRAAPQFRVVRTRWLSNRVRKTVRVGVGNIIARC